MEQTGQFLDLLYGNLQGETVEFRLVDKTGDQPTKQFFVEYPFNEDTFKALKSWNDIGYNIYFGVATRSYGKPNLLPALWVDVDFKALDSSYLSADISTRLKLFGADYPPSIIVCSGNGIHAYWLLADPLPPDEHANAEVMNRKLAMVFNGDSVGDAPRVLRVPGYANTKDLENPVPCTVFYAEPIWYNYTELDNWLAHVPVKRVGRKIEVLIKEGNRGQYASRSEADFAVVCSLVKAGYLDDAIRVIFENEGIGEKYRDKDQYKDAYLQNTIDAARARRKGI